MQSNVLNHVRCYLAALALVTAALLPGTGAAASRLDDQKISKPRVFHVATTDESGKVSLADLYEGGAISIGSADQKHSIRVTGQALEDGRVRLILEDTTANELTSSGETLILVPGEEPAWSKLASLYFALDEGDSALMSTPDGGTCRGGDPTTENAFCVTCRGRAYCCNPPRGYCCTITACGWSVRHCH